MTFILLASLTSVLLGWLMGFLSLFLVLLILVQRGKGGGLAGALGGPGGESAFGSKGADTFTTITIVVALCWGFTCAFTMYVLGTTSTPDTETKTNMQAGPGDGDFESGIEITGTEDTENSGADSIEGLNMSPNSTDDSTTPSADLTPADEVPVEPTADEATPSTESTGESPAESTTPEGESDGDSGETTTPDETAEPVATESADPESTDP